MSTAKRDIFLSPQGSRVCGSRETATKVIRLLTTRGLTGDVRTLISGNLDFRMAKHLLLYVRRINHEDDLPMQIETLIARIFRRLSAEQRVELIRVGLPDVVLLDCLSADDYDKLISDWKGQPDRIEVLLRTLEKRRMVDDFKLVIGLIKKHDVELSDWTRQMYQFELEEPVQPENTLQNAE